jgi:hypothetical protein
MMTREEFEKTIRAMKAEGLALSMPNLMVRTELPRATIEDWLEEMEAGKKPPPRESPRAAKSSGKPSEAEEKGDLAGDLLRKMEDLKGDLVKTAAAEVLKEKLGLADPEDKGDEGPSGDGRSKAVATVEKPRKDLRVAGVLGMVLGPLGLTYSAPWKVAVPASAGYLVLLALTRVPGLGAVLGLFVPSVMVLIHLACAAGGAAYAWRFNRTGKRAALLPEEKPRSRSRG